MGDITEIQDGTWKGDTCQGGGSNLGSVWHDSLNKFSSTMSIHKNSLSLTPGCWGDVPTTTSYCPPQPLEETTPTPDFWTVQHSPQPRQNFLRNIALCMWEETFGGQENRCTRPFLASWLETDILKIWCFVFFEHIWMYRWGPMWYFRFGMVLINMRYTLFLLVFALINLHAQPRFAQNCAKISTGILNFCGSCAKFSNIRTDENLFAQKWVRIR